jgi:tRNA pseudouridine38-40 synthase
LLNRYFIHLSYKGTNYHGWQVQPDDITVQEVLNRSLSTLLRTEVDTLGCGRTDAGVHATNFYAHIDSERDDLYRNEKFIHQLNCILPKDIVVYNFLPMREGAHARFDAVSRTYHYRISRVKDPFNTEFAMKFTRPLNVEAMNMAAEILKEYTDFTSFSKVNTDVKTNNCKIYQAVWSDLGTELQFTICADRFLRNMVRAIVGTLMEVGLGKNNYNDIRTIIDRKNRSEAGTSVEACGLHLVNIQYPGEIFLR